MTDNHEAECYAISGKLTKIPRGGKLMRITSKDTKKLFRSLNLMKMKISDKDKKAIKRFLEENMPQRKMKTGKRVSFTLFLLEKKFTNKTMKGLMIPNNSQIGLIKALGMIDTSRLTGKQAKKFTAGLHKL